MMKVSIQTQQTTVATYLSAIGKAREKGDVALVERLEESFNTVLAGFIKMNEGK
jgi:hypothetical protein